jgi:hypothetical protein
MHSCAKRKKEKMPHFFGEEAAAKQENAASLKPKRRQNT